jgi:glycosyltransferase involved in cell wall biosynthesis
LRILGSQHWDLINVHTGRAHTWSVLSQFLKTSRARVPVIRTRGDARELNVNMLDRVLYHRTAAVIAASDHIRHQYELELKILPGFLKTIYPSVDAVEPWTPGPAGRIGVVGRLDPVKGHAVLLEAAVTVLKEKPDTKFLIAGKEAGVSAEVLLNQARVLGVEKAFEFLGFVPSMPEFMSGCAFGVIASIGSEEISRACLEWMAVGRGVVATTVGSLRELVRPGKTGLLVPPQNAHELAQAILTMLRNPDRANGMGQEAHQVAKEEFGPAMQLKKTMALYNAVLDN